MPLLGLKARLRRFVVSCLRQAIEESAIGRTPAGTQSQGTTGQSLRMLEGNEYARYAMPLDYAPSRRFSPRWGYDAPPIKALYDWFEESKTTYRATLEEMRSHRAALLDVPADFDTRNLPRPAWFGVPICTFDSTAIYTMVRRYRPRRYFEIGSGISTCFAYKAMQDAGLDSRIISVDPEPRAAIDAICDEVIREGLETLDVTVFDQLEEGDIVFMDGSHRSFMNSDVTVFMIDVLPRLKPGVVIHVHDIALPWDYGDYFKNWYWNEQYLLAVYLMNARHRIDPLFPTQFVCREASFADWFADPLIDFGRERNGSWLGGGSMWFTHKG